MLLAIDIGNSTIKLGFMGGGALRAVAMATHPLKTPSAYSKAVVAAMDAKGMSGRPTGAVIASVVPGHTEALRLAAMELTGQEPVVVGPSAAGGLVLDVQSPQELGADRIADAAAAAELFGAPVSVVDFGTATTVDFVDEGPVLRGGVIMPGVGLMLKSLSTGTARLPLLEPGRPEGVIGRDTEGCMMSGVIYGTAGAVERVVEEAERSSGKKYKMVATGGFAELVRPYLRRSCRAEPYLTFKGLGIIYQRSRGDA